ncbi:MAG: hypothetical protein OXG82_07935 [Gammaproteobacteria bacterium]|nr:hypothetical protein [Gammaproteobacteria bacterium]
MRLFDTHIVVDWSARSKPSPAKPTRDAIWWALARDGVVARPAYVRTRHAAINRLARLIAAERAARRRVLVGFDFPFGYPAGVALHLTGRGSAFALWDWLTKRIVDDERNANNRYAVAAEINRCYPGVGPCWGRPATWPYPDVPARAHARTHRAAQPAERRIADVHAKGAKTVWQLAYTGSVGSQVLLGLPALERLRTARSIAGSVAVWPFDGGLAVPDKPVVFAELYPSLLRTAVARYAKPSEIHDRAQVRLNARAFASLDAAGGLASLFHGSPALTARERRLIETEEAWVLGVGHEAVLHEAAG